MSPFPSNGRRHLLMYFQEFYLFSKSYVTAQTSKVVLYMGASLTIQIHIYSVRPSPKDLLRLTVYIMLHDIPGHILWAENQTPVPGHSSVYFINRSRFYEKQKRFLQFRNFSTGPVISVAIPILVDTGRNSPVFHLGQCQFRSTSCLPLTPKTPNKCSHPMTA